MRGEGEMVPSEPEGPGKGDGGTPDEKQWYYSRSGKSYGPVSEEQLKTLARQGYFEKDDYVYAAFIGDWVKAVSVYGLFEGVGGEAIGGGGLGGEVEAPPAAEVGTFAAPAAAVPEGLRYYARYAGFWVRFLAVFIDGLVLAIPSCVVMGMMQAMFALAVAPRGMGRTQSFGSAGGVLLSIMMMVTSNLVMTAISWLYFSLMESSRWQATLGKRAVGIIVTDLAGKRMSFGRATGRHWSSVLSGLMLNIGYLLAVFTERKQTLHDMIAGTVVVYGHTG